MVNLRWIVALGLSLLALPHARAQSQDKQIDSMAVQGTVGPYRIGLVYTTENNTRLISAQYFYDTQLKDIPLTGSVQGQNVEWKGADGSLFHLHFVGNGSNGTEPLTFDNSVGLSGTWVLGPRTLPVTLVGGHSIENPGTRQYEDVTSASDADFESTVRSTIAAILSGDRTATANHIHFPLRVNRPHQPLIIGNAAELNNQWQAIFTPALLTRIRGDIPHYMFVHNGEATPGDGDLWFDAKGLVSIN